EAGKGEVDEDLAETSGVRVAATLEEIVTPAGSCVPAAET
ncbi:hypothetical protein Tco_0701781, partial [Tanacetum coccineum]